eukprot:TRINITY_DN25213_c0_g1_i1.p1 TRINITY_DN25213_c0_g1~~TRINITY_DN25213_c0_g1_i1.p1  ORF type:complete len:668 (+),score=56.33 TRINITY_DN25213_c0_g1_i1:76-2004(+)
MAELSAAAATIVWHQRDLRLRDNQIYSELSGIVHRGKTGPLLPVYVVDPHDFEPRSSCVRGVKHQVAMVGPYAARFLVESLQDLRSSLRKRKSDLFIRSGRPREVLPALVRELRSSGWAGDIQVIWHEEVGSYEEREAREVRAALETLGVKCLSRWGCTMWHLDDLPEDAAGWGLSSGAKGKGGGKNGKRKAASIESSDHVSTKLGWSILSKLGVQSFRRKAKATTSIREPYPELVKFPAPPENVSVGDLPTMPTLMASVCERPVFGLSKEVVEQVVQTAAAAHDKRSSHPFQGGETNAEHRLKSFIADAAATVSRDGGGGFDVGVDCSSKFSAYLAFGCISPRTIAASFRARADGKADWLAEQLEMRDFWIFCARAQGHALFHRDNDGSNPMALKSTHWKSYEADPFHKWATATTGFPVMDAAMTEMLSTGFTCNRARQICVSMLARDLLLDWRLGAEYFQWLLVDHDVGSNWGNWRYFAGVGCDPKQRYYCSISQGLRYDPRADFVRLWLPVLQHLSDKSAHFVGVPGNRPPTLPQGQWPEPVIDPMKHISFHDSKLVQHSTRTMHESGRRVGTQTSNGCDGGLKESEIGKEPQRGFVAAPRAANPHAVSMYDRIENIARHCPAAKGRRWKARSVAVAES